MDIEILEMMDTGGVGSVAKGVVNGKVFAAYLICYGSRFSWRIKTEGEFSGVERMAAGKNGTERTFERRKEGKHVLWRVMWKR